MIRNGFHYLNTKPGVGIQADLSHPLCPDVGLYLFNEGGGNIINNNVGKIVSPDLLADYTWGASPLGSTVTMGTATSGPRSNLGNYYFGSSPFTVIICLTPIAQRFQKDVNAVGKWYTGGSPGQNEWLLTLNFQTIGSEYYPSFVVDDGSLHSADDTNQWTAGQPLFLAGVRNGTSVQLYRGDGAIWKGLTATGSCGSGPLSQTNLNITLGDFLAAYTLNTNARYHYFAMYQRALSASDLEQIFNDPYCMMQPPKVWSWFETSPNFLPILPDLQVQPYRQQLVMTPMGSI